MRPVAFDVDGTLLGIRDLDAGDPATWRNARAIEQHSYPLPGARAAVQRAAHLRGVVFITGRTEILRRITVEQIQVHMGIGRPRVLMQQAWHGWDALRDHKVLGLQQTRACCMVGDSQVDVEAARVAGVEYRHPREVGIQVEVVA